MIWVGIKFLSGRYHATPWSRHVNEGEVEWPPSPWRICRALIATGFSKLGWAAVPSVAIAALERLAEAPPTYHLPPAGAAHTRHYMPGYKDSSDKVLDTFAYPGRTNALIIEWPVVLDSAQRALIDQLFRCMSYLGRAESWIEAQLLPELPPALVAGHSRCAPGDVPPGSDYQRLGLLAPMAVADYLSWRAATESYELERRLAAKRQQAAQSGKQPPGAVSKREREQVAAELPQMLIDALCTDTAVLQRAAWSQPPGSRWLTYWRVRDVLGARPIRASAPSPRRHDTALLALTPDTRSSMTLPRMRDALWRCEALHKALVRESAGAAADGIPSATLTGCGPDRVPLQGHRHATLIPLDLDDDSRIDHIAVYAPDGLDSEVMSALRRVRVTYAKDLPRIFVTVVDTGRRGDFSAQIAPLARARAWVSATPFVPPRHLKQSGRSSLLGQLCSELDSRGLPQPRTMEVQVSGQDPATESIRYVSAAEFWALWRRRRPMVELGPDAAVPAAADHPDPGASIVLAPAWRHFRRVRQTSPSRPPVSVALGLRLVFDSPIDGPVSLGYASHYGLGVFRPA